MPQVSFLPQFVKEGDFEGRIGISPIRSGKNQTGYQDKPEYFLKDVIVIKPNADDFSLLKGVTKAFDEPYGSFRMQTIARQALIIARQALNYFRQEGAPLPLVITNLGEVVTGAMGFGTFMKLFFADTRDVAETMYDEVNCGENLCKAYPEECTGKDAWGNPTAPEQKEELMPRTIVDKVLNRTVARIPVFGLDMQKYLAGKEVVKACSLESVHLKAADKLVEISLTTANAVVLTVGLIGAASLPVVGSVIGGLNFARAVADAVISGNELRNLSKIGQVHVEDAVNEVLKDFLPSKLNDQEKADCTKVDEDSSLEDVLKATKLLNDQEKADYAIQAKKEFMADTLQTDFNAKGDFETQLLQARLKAEGNDCNFNLDREIEKRIYNNMKFEITFHYNERINEFTRSKRINHVLNILKVGCYAIPLILSIGSIFVPALTIPAAIFVGLSVVVATAKMILGKYEPYKGEEQVHLCDRNEEVLKRKVFSIKTA